MNAILLRYAQINGVKPQLMNYFDQPKVMIMIYESWENSKLTDSTERSELFSTLNLLTAETNMLQVSQEVF